jgi:hypothetical protein
LRVIPGQIDRAKVRTTLMYRPHPQISIGVEYNPYAKEVRPLLTLIPLKETKNRPAIIFGFSSDRIGTPSGSSFYLTASKDLTRWIKLPIAPYGGIVYGTYEKKWRAIGGLNIRFRDNLTSLIQFDGVKVHPTLTYNFNEAHGLTFLLIRGKNPGFTYTYSF